MAAEAERIARIEAEMERARAIEPERRAKAAAEKQAIAAKKAKTIADKEEIKMLEAKERSIRNANSRKNRYDIITTKKSRRWNKISIGYGNIAVTSIASDIQKQIYGHGVTLDYVRGVAISKSKPLFLDFGFMAQYTQTTSVYTHSDSYNTTTKESLRFTSFVIPTNLSYQFKISERFAIIPSAGLNLKCNAVASFHQNSSSASLLKADLLKSQNPLGVVANRIQFGGQAGLGISYRKLHLGACYYRDITRFSSNDLIKNTGLVQASIGVIF